MIVAPLSDVLDGLTFLSIERARVLLAVWAVALALWGALRSGTVVRRITRAVLGPLLLVVVAAATVALPRPVARFAATDSAVTVIDYHAHTEESHDGRPGWTALDLARWHAAQGFAASYVTDHNHVFDGRVDDPIALLQGAEWSVSGQHILALGELTPIDRDPYNRDTRSMLGVFAELHRRGALTIASTPRILAQPLGRPRRLRQGGRGRLRNRELRAQGDRVPRSGPRPGRPARPASTTSCSSAGATTTGGARRPACGTSPAPAITGTKRTTCSRVPSRCSRARGSRGPRHSRQPWFMLRSLTWPERVSWLTWIVVILIYRAVPRRDGDPGGIGILARSLSLRVLRLRKPASTT